MTEKKPRATPMAPEDRRRAIIEAVVPLLRLHGPGVTTKQVAEAAGIAEGTIFRVFPDKKALLLATAEETVNPAGGREDMARRLADLPDLRSHILATVEHLIARLEDAMVVMMALRPALVDDASQQHEHQHGAAKRPPGPPEFLVESNRQLLRNLADLVFAPHADELRVQPEKAALILRSLVFGAWHPGMEHDVRLTPGEIADACLCGVTQDKTALVSPARDSSAQEGAA